VPDAVDLIRSGKARLAARRTARIEVTYRFTYHDAVDESRLTGIIDFEQGRYRTSGDGEEQIGIGGMGFTRTERDGRWIVKGGDPAAAPVPGDVLWMLDLLAGVIRAEELDSPRPGRVSYACAIDLLKADEHSAAGVARPGGYTVRQLQQLELRVDLDNESTVRSIKWSLPDGNGATLEFVELEIDAPPIEPPPEDQRVQIWELLEDEEE
jgi:hypothetical protein